MKIGEVADLPTTLDGRQTAELLGCSYWSLLQQVKAGTCPVAPLRLGRALRWPTRAVLKALHLDSAGCTVSRLVWRLRVVLLRLKVRLLAPLADWAEGRVRRRYDDLVAAEARLK